MRLGEDKLPSILIFGGARCGTTSLYNYLNNHPKLYLPFIKETNFFHKDYDKGLEYYMSEYYSDKKKDQIGVDISPKYLYDPDVPRRVYESIPDAKVVIILRNPIERAWSEFVSAKRLGNDKRDFQQALIEELKKIEQGDVDKSLISQGYLYRSLYDDHLQRIYSHFKKEQVYIFDFEDLKKDINKFMRNFCNRLEISFVDGLVANKKIYNSSHVEAKFSFIEKILWKKSGIASTIRELAKIMVPRRLRPKIVEFLRKKNLRNSQKKEIPDHARIWLENYFKNRFEALDLEHILVKFIKRWDL